MPNESPNLDNIFDNLEEKNPEENKNFIINNPDSSNKTLSTEKILIKSAPESNNLDILTELDKLELLKMWENDPENPPSIESLCEKIRPKKMLDGRSKIGREIKKYISSLNLPAPKTKTNYEKKPDIILTDEQKEFIKSNPNMKATEIASALFEKPFYAALSQEVRTILTYQKELETTTGFKKTIQDNDICEEYRPPKTFDHVCARINKYIRDANYDSKKISASIKKCCLQLISYLHAYRFNYQINSYSKNTDKELFESVYISYCYDKPDLSREDVDKMTILATEAVISANKLRSIEMYQNEQEKSIQESGKVSMSIVEAINVATTEYNSSVKRQRDLYNDLSEKRSERLKGKLKETASVLNLVELWKNEETRNKMIQIANQRKEKLKEEIDRLSNMDDLIGTIFGLDRNEILNN